MLANASTWFSDGGKIQSFIIGIRPFIADNRQKNINIVSDLRIIFDRHLTFSEYVKITTRRVLGLLFMQASYLKNRDTLVKLCVPD